MFMLLGVMRKHLLRIECTLQEPRVTQWLRGRQEIQLRILKILETKGLLLVTSLAPQLWDWNWTKNLQWLRSKLLIRTLTHMSESQMDVGKTEDPVRLDVPAWPMTVTWHLEALLSNKRNTVTLKLLILMKNLPIGLSVTMEYTISCIMTKLRRNRLVTSTTEWVVLKEEDQLE